MTDDLKKLADAIGEVYEKWENGYKLILVEKGSEPATFAADMHCIFNSDENKDYINNIYYIDGTFWENGWDVGDLILVPNTIDDYSFFVALADYVHSINMDHIICFTPQKEGYMGEWEIDNKSDFVEGGGSEAIIDWWENIYVLEGNYSIAFHDKVTFGTTLGEPSDVAKEIKAGKHFIEYLCLPDDKEISF